MPEGHTVHRMARLQRRHYAGRPVAVSSPQGRFTTGAEIVDGRVLERVEAHGKHLFQVYGPDLVVHVHLGLWGRFGNRRLPVQPPRGQVRMRIVGRAHYADLRGPSACELFDDVEVKALRARLGEDPLRDDADPDRAWAQVSRSRSPLATLLMDQSVIAGLGNVFRAETLFRTGLDPMLPGRELGRERFDALWADLSEMLRDGERAGKIETLRPEHDPARLETTEARGGAERRIDTEARGGVEPRIDTEARSGMVPRIDTEARSGAVPRIDTDARGGVVPRIDTEARSGVVPRIDTEAAGVCASVVYTYRRTGQPCLVCGTPIAHARHRARNLFWCPTCQAG